MFGYIERFNWRLNIVEFSWYPIAALIMYTLFYFSWKLPISNRAKTVVLLVLVIVVTTLEYFVIGIHKDWWLISNLAFPVGILLFYHKILFNKHRILSIIIGVIGCIFGMAILSISSKLFGVVTDGLYIIGTNFQTSFLAVAMIFSISAFTKRKNNKVINFLNGISYEMYLCHGLLIFIFTKFITNGYIITLLVLLLTPLLAYILNMVDNLLIKNLLKLKIKD